jgi:hypothetical protein
MPPAKTGKDHDLAEANLCIGAGVGVGLLGAGGALLSGAVCPMCVVAAPALIGAGIFQRWRRLRANRPA